MFSNVYYEAGKVKILGCRDGQGQVTNMWQAVQAQIMTSIRKEQERKGKETKRSSTRRE